MSLVLFHSFVVFCLLPTHTPHVCPLRWWPLLGMWSEYTVSIFSVAAPERVHSRNPTCRETLQSKRNVNLCVNCDVQSVTLLTFLFVLIVQKKCIVKQSLALLLVAISFFDYFPFLWNVFGLKAGWHLNDGTSVHAAVCLHSSSSTLSPRMKPLMMHK